MNEPPARLLFIVSSLVFGGAEKHIVTLANRLDRERFEVVFAYLKPVESLLQQLDTKRLNAVLSLNVSAKLDWSAVRTLARAIDAYGVDVVVCVNAYPALYALLAARRARRAPKLVEIFHTTTFGRLKDSLHMILYRQVIRCFDLLVFVSFKQQAYWRARRLRAQCDAVVQNGIDTQFFRDRYDVQQKAALRARFGFTPHDYIVGICAALRPEKAHGDLLHALARLRSRGVADVKGLIIGDGAERKHIESLIGSLGLAGSVVIAGFQQDVRPYIACCDVMTLPSVETFSLAALEAMSLGKPVVLSRIGGAEEQITDGVNGLLFDAGDVDRLTQHLAALANPELRERLSRAAVARVVEMFDESRMVAAYTDLLSNLSSVGAQPLARTNPSF